MAFDKARLVSAKNKIMKSLFSDLLSEATMKQFIISRF